MKLSSKKSSNFEPCPEFTGRGVCVDITPPKEVQTDFGPKMKFRVVFEIDIEKESADPKRKGERHCVWSSGFTESLHEKAGFRKFLKQWFGRDLNAQELEEFDTETLIGKPAFLVVTHTHDEKKDTTYANITACTPFKSGDPLKPSGKFTREKDREKKPEGDKAAGAKAEYRKAEGGDEAPRDNWQKTKVHVGRHKGIDVGDLDEEAIKGLVEKWLPGAKANAKPTADDKRLIAALEAAMKELGGDAGAGEPAADTDY